ncbi:MAG: hypothetical protein ABJV68_18070 [Paracoccaceae bacterium]
MDDHEIKALNMPGASHPEPANKELEVACVGDAIDSALEDETAQNFCDANIWRLTPWVSFQLGCAAEYYGKYQEVKNALKIAHFSVEVARRIQDPVRFCSNLVTLGNTYFRLNENEKSLANYQAAIQYSDPVESPEATAALMGMANSLQRLDRNHEATIAFEAGYLRLRGSLNEVERRQIATSLAGLCKRSYDVGGAYFAICEFDKVAADKILFANSLDQMTYDEAVSIHTRLLGLGMGKDARRLRDSWLEANVEIEGD